MTETPHDSDSSGEGPVGLHVNGPRGFAFLLDETLAQRAIEALAALTGDDPDDYTVVRGREFPPPIRRAADVVLSTATHAIEHLRKAFPELSERALSAQTSWWVDAMGARGRVLRIAHSGAIKRAATALRIAGPAAGGFEIRLPLKAGQLDALVFAELHVLASEAAADARAQIETVLARLSVVE